MSDLQPYPAAQSPNGLSRRTSRGLANLQNDGVLQLAKIEQSALIQTSKVDAVTYVGRAAMQQVAMVSQLEQQLAQAVPMATTRLQGIADITAVALAEVVVDTAARMRRL